MIKLIYTYIRIYELVYKLFNELSQWYYKDINFVKLQ